MDKQLLHDVDKLPIPHNRDGVDTLRIHDKGSRCDVHPLRGLGTFHAFCISRGGCICYILRDDRGRGGGDGDSAF